MCFATQEAARRAERWEPGWQRGRAPWTHTQCVSTKEARLLDHFLTRGCAAGSGLVYFDPT